MTRFASSRTTPETSRWRWWELRSLEKQDRSGIVVDREVLVEAFHAKDNDENQHQESGQTRIVLREYWPR